MDGWIDNRYKTNLKYGYITYTTFESEFRQFMKEIIKNISQSNFILSFQKKVQSLWTHYMLNQHTHFHFKKYPL